MSSLIIQKWFDEDLTAPTGGSPDVNVSLSGQDVAASAGTLGVSHAQGLTGSAVTASAGAITVTVTVPLVGTAVVSSAGALTPSTTIGLIGTAVTVSAGTLTPSGGDTPDVTLALNGQAVTVSAGTLAPSSAVALSGSAAAVSAGAVSSQTAIGLTGVAVTSSAGTLTPSTAQDITIALNGQVVLVQAGTLTASGGDSTAAEQPTGGGAPFYGHFYLAYERQLRRRREEERKRLEALAEVEEIEEATAREIAQLLHKQEALDAERRELERLENLVREYRRVPQVDLPSRTQKAFVRAAVQRNISALQALDREMRRMLEEEEIAVLMLLLNED